MSWVRPVTICGYFSSIGGGLMLAEKIMKHFTPRVIDASSMYTSAVAEQAWFCPVLLELSIGSYILLYGFRIWDACGKTKDSEMVCLRDRQQLVLCLPAASEQPDCTFSYNLNHPMIGQSEWQHHMWLGCFLCNWWRCVNTILDISHVYVTHAHTDSHTHTLSQIVSDWTNFNFQIPLCLTDYCGSTPGSWTMRVASLHQQNSERFVHSCAICHWQS